MKKIMLEVCVDSPESILNAKNGGADRLELCSSLSLGGLTPTLGLAKFAIQHTNIPGNALIRLRNGNFVYSEEEIEIMVEDIYQLKQAGVSGFVIGALTELGEIDIKAMEKLLAASTGCDVTFHRAFDLVKDPLKSLNIIIELGIKRILTSGLESTAEEGIELLKSLQLTAGDRLIIMPGAGVTDANVKKIIAETNVKEVHASCKITRSSKSATSSNVSMGSDAESESSIFVTCQTKVVNLKQLINSECLRS